MPVAPPTAGLDVTQAIVYGSQSLRQLFNKLTYPEKLELADRLITPPYAACSWDIETLKFHSTDPDTRTRQTMCTPGQGKNDDAPYTLVTVRDGLGKLEVYPTDAVNYFLFGEAMGLVYNDWDNIKAYIKSSLNSSLWSAADPWLLLFESAKKTEYSIKSTAVDVGVYRSIYSAWADGAGISLPIAFAKVGYSSAAGIPNGSYITGQGIQDATPCSTSYCGCWTWFLGKRFSLSESSIIILCQYVGCNGGSWGTIDGKDVGL